MILSHNAANPNYNENEPNDTYAQAQALLQAKIIEGAIGYYNHGYLVDRWDIFSFSLDRAVELEITAVIASSLVNNSLYLTILDQNQTHIKTYILNTLETNDRLNLEAGN